MRSSRQLISKGICANHTNLG